MMFSIKDLAKNRYRQTVLTEYPYGLSLSKKYIAFMQIDKKDFIT